MEAKKANDTYTPRFDFGSNLDPEGTQMGTIKELLVEINQQYSSAKGVAADIKSLRVTLRFLSHFTNEEYKKTTVKLPLSTLKTIKLLYVTNSAKDIQMFRLIAPVHASEQPTMEFATGGTVAQDKYGASIIHTLCEHLAREIQADKLKSFSHQFKNSVERSAAQELNDHIERNNDVIEQLLKSEIGNDNFELARAYSLLSKAIDRTKFVRKQDENPPSLNEAVFVHLLSLGFVHFAVHHREFFETIQIDAAIGALDDQINAFCLLLRRNDGLDLSPSHETFSVNNFHKVIEKYPKHLSSLVKGAIGLGTRKPRLLRNIGLAKFILTSVAFRRYDETDLNALRLSMYDIIAAMCSVRYQQEVRTKSKPYWSGQRDLGGSPQRHFDKFATPGESHYQGVLQIYLYRTGEYRAAFTRTTESHRAWMTYQQARLDAYARILQMNDISSIVTNINCLDEFCLHRAVLIAHGYTGDD